MNQVLKFFWVALFLYGCVGLAVEHRAGFDFGYLEKVAIQDRGRVKPLHTFAEESLLFVTGKRSWNGIDAVEVLSGWLLNFEKEWLNEPFIRLDHLKIKERLGLAKDRKFFSPLEFDENSELGSWQSEISQKQKDKVKLSDVENKVLQLGQARLLVLSVVAGDVLNILPNTKGINEPWFSIAAMAEPGMQMDGEKISQFSNILRQMLNSFRAREAFDWNQSTRNLFEFISKQVVSAEKYPELTQLNREIHYNNLRPFRMAWQLYALTFVLWLLVLIFHKKILIILGWTSLFAGFFLHCYGFILRCLISGRPPVTNMYESVIWVAWGVIVFSLLIFLKYRNRVIAHAATTFSIAALLLADLLPTVLDGGISPLEPVLRSNFWLTIHVLTITLSYAAFALSLCLGNVVLGYYCKKNANSMAVQTYTMFMYRAMQIGIVLLAAGTILGGIWADYSWGRFWGWDPKEVWALIALLLYLAVLHGRFTGWLKGFGFTVCAVCSFMGVLMAWYGVNFVLGAGLHSYGFGAGGMEYVASYLGVQIGFMILSYSRYRKNPEWARASILPKT